MTDDLLLAAVGTSGNGLPTRTADAGLPRLTVNEPVAVLMVDTGSGSVTYANGAGLAMAQHRPLPLSALEWSEAAGLTQQGGDGLIGRTSPVVRVADGQTVVGEPVALPARTGEDGRVRPGRALWVTGFPLPQESGLAQTALVAFFAVEAEAAAMAPPGDDPLVDLDALRGRALLASAHAFSIVDPSLPDAPLIWVNPAFEQMTGYSLDDAVGRNCRFLQGPDTDPRHIQSIRDALEARRAVRVELLNYRADGTAFYNDLSVSPIFDGEGEVTHFVGVQTDVTARTLASRERDRLLAAERRSRGLAEEARSRLHMASEVAKSLSQTLDVQDAMDRLVDVLVPSFGDWAAVDLPDGGRRRRVAASHREPGLTPLVMRLGALESLRGTSAVQDILGGGPSWLRESIGDEDYVRHTGGEGDWLDVIRRLGGRSALSVPLRARGRAIGALTLVRTGDGDRAYDREDLAFAEDLAERAALSVDNLRLYEAEAAGRARAALLAEASLALSASLDPGEVSHLLADVVVPDLGQAAFVHVTDQDGSLVLLGNRHQGHDEGALDAAAGSAADDLVETLALMDRLLRSAEGPGPTTAHRLVAPVVLTPALGGGRTGVAVPLLARGRSLGTLSLLRTDGPDLTPAEVEVLTELGRRGGLALDNARLYENERSVAVALQRALLPQALPDVAGLSFAARYLAGAAGTQVGGDWYDVLPLADGSVGLAVGDVMGRGIHAAAVMGQLRAALRSYAVERLDPAEALRRLDDFTSVLDGEHLTTVVFGVYEPARGEIELAMAGHLPPVVIRPGSPPEFVEADPGLPLGVGGSAFRTTRVPMPPGTLLLMYTDGLVESRDAGVTEGMAMLRSGLSGVSVLSAEQAADLALHVMGRDGDHDDDTAVLSILVRRPDATSSAVMTAEPVRLQLAPTDLAPRTARVFLVEQLEARGLSDSFGESAALLLSELVTNAVRHAGTEIEVQVAVDARLLRVAVLDASADLPDRGPGEDDHEAESGRGLRLLDQLAPRWGSERLSSGKRVWFELDG